MIGTMPCGAASTHTTIYVENLSVSHCIKFAAKSRQQCFYSPLARLEIIYLYSCIVGAAIYK